ncbi:hypothetical protein Ahy_B02g060799 [Arachis hypogaea]|uniref:FAR1 domain-containing protein n=2 Tax=Arachis TaxID=3817 RepID=A0A445AJK0_ARAHY|nr:hypothetical protein Ahy_B02g060799 [Arachis hypogaea]
MSDLAISICNIPEKSSDNAINATMSTGPETSFSDGGTVVEDTILDTCIEGDVVGSEARGQFKMVVIDSSRGYGHIMVEEVMTIKFGTPGEAREFYAAYSRVKGFTIRKSKSKNAKGEVVRYNFACSREGFRHRKWLEKSDRKLEHKPVTMCGYLAEMRIK